MNFRQWMEEGEGDIDITGGLVRGFQDLKNKMSNAKNQFLYDKCSKEQQQGKLSTVCKLFWNDQYGRLGGGDENVAYFKNVIDQMWEGFPDMDGEQYNYMIGSQVMIHPDLRLPQEIARAWPQNAIAQVVETPEKYKASSPNNHVWVQILSNQNNEPTIVPKKILIPAHMGKQILAQQQQPQRQQAQQPQRQQAQPQQQPQTPPQTPPQQP